MEVVEPVRELTDSTDLRGDRDALRDRLAHDGYVLIRGLHDPERVLATRRALVEAAARQGAFRPGTDPMDAVVNPACRGIDARELLQLPQLQDLLAGPAVMGFFSELVGGTALTYDVKWLRFTPTGGGSWPHCDRVFMGRGTDQLYTLWTPIGDVSREMGALSLYLDCGARQQILDTYAREDVDVDNIDGHMAQDVGELISRYGGYLATTDFAAGDALVFTPYTFHVALPNRTDRYRISCDTRYQDVALPVDGRWVGARPIGHHAWRSRPPESVSAGRRRWGF